VPIPTFCVEKSPYIKGVAEVLSLLNDVWQSLERELVLNVDGETALRILVGTGAGQNWSVSIWCELA